MAAKLGLIFVVAACLFHFFVLQSEANVITFRERRDAPSGNQPKPEIQDLLDSAKQSLDEFLQKIQSNELFQNASKVFDEFGQKVKATGDELIAKVTNSTRQ